MGGTVAIREKHPLYSLLSKIFNNPSQTVKNSPEMVGRVKEGGCREERESGRALPRKPSLKKTLPLNASGKRGRSLGENPRKGRRGKREDKLSKGPFREGTRGWVGFIRKRPKKTVEHSSGLNRDSGKVKEGRPEEEGSAGNGSAKALLETFVKKNCISHWRAGFIRECQERFSTEDRKTGVSREARLRTPANPCT